jgi:hypothetical protein
MVLPERKQIQARLGEARKLLEEIAITAYLPNA